MGLDLVTLEETADVCLNTSHRLLPALRTEHDGDALADCGAQVGIGQWNQALQIRSPEYIRQIGQSRSRLEPLQDQCQGRNVLNAWSSTLKGIDGDTDRFLATGICSYQAASAAALMAGYQGFDLSGFRRMMLDVFYPMNKTF